jgi:hypothetical protein
MTAYDSSRHGRAAVERQALSSSPAPLEPTRRRSSALGGSLGQVLNDQERQLARVVAARTNDLERPVPPDS